MTDEISSIWDALAFTRENGLVDGAWDQSLCKTYFVGIQRLLDGSGSPQLKAEFDRLDKSDFQGLAALEEKLKMNPHAEGNAGYGPPPSERRLAAQVNGSWADGEFAKYLSGMLAAGGNLTGVCAMNDGRYPRQLCATMATLNGGTDLLHSKKKFALIEICDLIENADENDFVGLQKLERGLADMEAMQRKMSTYGSASHVTHVEDEVDKRKRDPKKGFATGREFLQAIIAHTSGARPDDRLKSLAVGSDEQSTISDPYGGFLVPEAFSGDLKSTGGNLIDPTAAMTTKIPMAKSPVVKVPARVDKDHSTSVSGGLQVYRRAETQTVNVSRVEFELIRMEAAELMGLSYSSNELLSDSSVNMNALLARGFGDEFSSRIIDEKIRGTGAGQYLGILNSPCKITVAAEAAQGAGTIVYANLVKMLARGWGYGLSWLYNKSALPALMQLTDAAGRLIWMPSATDDQPARILGLPMFESEACSNIGTEGDIILGNWGEYLEGAMDDNGLESSIHVRFSYNETAFRFVKRGAGAPWWRSPLTPKNSAPTQSPFVTLSSTRT